MFWILILAVCAARVQSQSHNVAVANSKWGTSSASSGHAASVAQDPFGSSIVSSEFAGSSSGTSGKASALGSNPFGTAASQSIRGTAMGTAGQGSSAAQDIYGHRGSASSHFDGASSNTAGLGSAQAVNNDVYGLSRYRNIPLLIDSDDVRLVQGKGRSIYTVPESGAFGHISGNNIFTNVKGLGDESLSYVFGDQLHAGVSTEQELGQRSGFEPLDMKVKRIVGEAVPVRYEVPTPFLFAPNGYAGSATFGGTATSSSGQAAASSEDRYGGSVSGSNYGGSASGTSGFGAATGSNQYGVSSSGSTQGIATGSSGDAASGSHDVYGHKGSSASYFGGAASETAGIGASQAANYGQYYDGVRGVVPVGAGYGNSRFLGGSHSVAMDGGTAAGASDTGSSSAAAPGVVSSAGVGSAGSAAGKRGASASAGGVSAAAARKSHKNKPNALPIFLDSLYPQAFYYPVRYIAVRR